MTLTAPPLDPTSHNYPIIPCCVHYAGNQRFIEKALALQSTLQNSKGTPLFDLTLDLEDGSEVGTQDSFKNLIVEVINSAKTRSNIGVRVRPLSSKEGQSDLEQLLSKLGEKIAYITIPKIREIKEVDFAAALIKKHCKSPVPLHALLETHEALREISKIAAHPAVQVLDFGIMDFISEHGGAIPESAMHSPEQFTNQLILRAKTTISSTALSFGKIPAHNPTVEAKSPTQAKEDARRAHRELGFLRMWSIHPGQIEQIISGMRPDEAELQLAKEVLEKAAAANWGPLQHKGRLHDRASFRYYWNLLQRQ